MSRKRHRMGHTHPIVTPALASLLCCVVCVGLGAGGCPPDVPDPPFRPDDPVKETSGDGVAELVVNGNSVRVTVRDADDDAPIAGVEVSISPDINVGLAFDEEGRYYPQWFDAPGGPAKEKNRASAFSLVLRLTKAVLDDATPDPKVVRTSEFSGENVEDFPTLLPGFYQYAYAGAVQLGELDSLKGLLEGQLASEIGDKLLVEAIPALAGGPVSLALTIVSTSLTLDEFLLARYWRNLGYTDDSWFDLYYRTGFPVSGVPVHVVIWPRSFAPGGDNGGDDLCPDDPNKTSPGNCGCNALETPNCGPSQFSWQPLGAGMNGSVQALTVYNGDLIAGGFFNTAGSVSANHVAKWNGSSWQPLATGVGGPNTGLRALTVYNLDLIAGGANVSSDLIERWNGSSWNLLDPSGFVFNSAVDALAVYNSTLVVGSTNQFSGAAIASWNGASWQQMDVGILGGVSALAVYNGELFAGGDFLIDGTNQLDNIARWNGASWQAMGTGIDSSVNVLTVYNGDLIAGGFFTTASGVSANSIARWNGASWQPLGTGTNGGLHDLAVYNGDLVAGGTFTTAGGVSANRVAKWDGSSWQALGSGVNGTVLSLTVYNSQIIAGGSFSTAGGVSANNIARWTP